MLSRCHSASTSHGREGPAFLRCAADVNTLNSSGPANESHPPIVHQLSEAAQRGPLVLTRLRGHAAHLLRGGPPFRRLRNAGPRCRLLCPATQRVPDSYGQRSAPSGGVYADGGELFSQSTQMGKPTSSRCAPAQADPGGFARTSRRSLEDDSLMAARPEPNEFENHGRVL
jgi:hypothetical protein